MILISHRGNLNGKNESKENHPDYILTAIEKGFDVEIDLWVKNNKLYLGHNNPDYEIDFDFLRDNNKQLWIHCKNLDALRYCNSLDFIDYEGVEINYFWHDGDNFTLTAQNYIWTYPRLNTWKMSNVVINQPEWDSEDLREEKLFKEKKYAGICSDYIEKYKEKV